MKTVGIIANGPVDHIPDLTQYKDMIDIWIGADRGALILAENNITADFALGDFDSISMEEKEVITNNSEHFESYMTEKDETDLEIALQKAFELNPEFIYLFGITGGRLDHALINIQLLYTIINQGIRGVIIDNWNKVELFKPGEYTVKEYENYPYISFVAFTEHVKNLSLTNFYYPLTGHDLSWSSTRCISNKLASKKGTFSFDAGKLLLIQSCDE